ncbi:MAG: 2-oxoglutarate dehydrogenase E1 component [Bacteroidales bacterium]|nr:2-oxoglutarate dehydrogenase E1 component [Lentimicrobiaceae bacterium]MDD5693678.1 2-oxoglutarate dehydrogenase E1 component [Bacteroidales bacterium]
MDTYSYLSNSDLAQLEEMYLQYKADPDSVDFGWKKFFEGYEFAGTAFLEKQKITISSDEFKVINLIHEYRKRGHLFTKTNPVRTRRTYTPSLSYDHFGLTANDLEKTFEAGREIGIGKARLKDIISFLEQTYCQSIGVEYFYIRNTEIVEWLRSKMESSRNAPQYSREQKIQILLKLTEAVGFEKFVHKKFPGQKRFSLEGGESLIPALDVLIEKGASLGIQEFVIGMPHRGRLNVLTNILGKSLQVVFSEFEGIAYDDETLLGDVKYHLGFTSLRQTRSGQSVRLTLTPNPSHLEAVNPVVEGIVKSRIDHQYHGDNANIVPVLIHGDASIAGQGVVYEVIQMSGLEAYHTGGTVHLVVNNQLGFTTNYLEGRTSIYCTDVAKTIQSPVFHVNGDDAEAVALTVEMAIEFRNHFHRDVFVDLLGYRKYGHNEGDEPRFTQPILYKIIENHPDPCQIYRKNLLEQGIVDQGTADGIEQDYHARLEVSLARSKEIERAHITSFLEDSWASIRKATTEDFIQSPDTSVRQDSILSITRKITSLPEDKRFFRKTVKLQEDRREMVLTNDRVDWGMAELLAYGTLLSEGINIRFSGQDSRRGTFSHRHAVLTLEDSEEKYIPLNHLDNIQGKFEIYNSHLSEYGVLGFEYGYALASPHDLVIWEAQFGDFSNGAQIIFDQYLSSAEDKWNVMNHLVVLLPHGYEGQGPEHSSGRMERFLTLCAEQNLQVANCSTPANFFHILRRQLKRPFRKPLIIFTPKSLLRHPRCVSPLSTLTTGGFNEIMDDDQAVPDEIEKLAFCSGRVYYDLLEEKEKIHANHIALIRIEQLYPLPVVGIKNLVQKYKHATRYLWVQEEPVNMGAWNFIHQLLLQEGITLCVIARPASGSPATGSPRFHQVQQRKIVTKTFDECDCHRLKEECRMVCIGNRWRQFEVEIQAINNKKNRLT